MPSSNEFLNLCSLSMFFEFSSNVGEFRYISASDRPMLSESVRLIL